MSAVFAVMFVQALMGAFDNFWHHELEARLPQRVSARRELALHAAREAIYGMLFLAFAWSRWEGVWVLVPCVLLAIEVMITCADFLEEDRSRRLPPLERVLHTLLALSYGILLGCLAPVFIAWANRPAAVRMVDQGFVSWTFTLFAVAVLAWSVRNGVAANRSHRTSGEDRAHALRAAGPAVLVTGATGFIGSELVRQLVLEGHRVIVLTRDVMQARASFGPQIWAVDRLDDIPDEARISSVVHLAGATVLGMPWTRGRREVLIASRTGIMRDLLRLTDRLHERPGVIVSASAVGYYGVPALARPLGEDEPPQPGRFQSDLCSAIEHEARRAEALGVRVVRMRFGLVLGHGGGSYPPLALAARLGLGARLGSGEQPVPWIHRDDAVALIRFALDHPAMNGAVNAVAPEPMQQGAFAAAIANSFGRSVWLSVPGWLLRRMMGEMSELLLGGQAAEPRAALAAGFAFRYPRLADAAKKLAAT